jgi:hypothetical protein
MQTLQEVSKAKKAAMTGMESIPFDAPLLRDLAQAADLS